MKTANRTDSLLQQELARAILNSAYGSEDIDAVVQRCEAAIDKVAARYLRDN